MLIFLELEKCYFYKGAGPLFEVLNSGPYTSCAYLPRWLRRNEIRALEKSVVEAQICESYRDSSHGYDHGVFWLLVAWCIFPTPAKAK